MSNEDHELRREVKAWLKSIGKTRHWLAEHCGVEKGTIDNWLANSERAIPVKGRTILNHLMRFDSKWWNLSDAAGELSLRDVEHYYAAARTPAAPNLTDSEWVQVRALADDAGESPEDFIAAAVRESINTALSLPRIAAAAGSAIEAEVLDWRDDATHIAVVLHGDSMSPRFQDGDAVTLRLKHTARSPFMRKGLLYLIRSESGYKFKRYNTRPATPREIAEEEAYIYRSPIDGTPKVRVLESLNPAHREQIASDSEEWVAWLEE